MKLPRCVKCGKYIRAEKDMILFDTPTSHPSRYICRECAEEEGMIDDEEDGNDRQL